MLRDPAIAVFVLLLAVLALPATGGSLLPLLSSSVQVFFQVAAILTALYLLAVAAVPGGSPWRPLTVALAAAPFFVFCALEAPLAGGGVRWPSLAFVAVFSVATLITALRPRIGRVVLALVITLMGGGAVLAEAGVPVGPRSWNPLLQPGPSMPVDSGDVPAGAVGRRVASPTRAAADALPSLARGPGPWWVRAARARSPGPTPVVCVFDGSSEPGPMPETDDVTFVHGSEAALDETGQPVGIVSPLDLMAFDAVVVFPRAGAGDGDRRRRALRAIAAWTRGGGLLIGPPPGQPWPARLARSLGEAGRAESSGPSGLTRFGLGRVVRAAGEAEVLELLRSDLWVREAFTVFDRARRAPAAPADFTPWVDHPERRRPAGLLLLGYGIAVLLFAWLLRGPGAQVLGTLLCALTVSAGLVWVSPADPGFVARGVVLELGGAGGRRIDALWISAGPAGFQRDVRFDGGGFVSRLGGRRAVDGPYAVRPRESAWFLRERPAMGVGPDDEEHRLGSSTRVLLRGTIDPKRLRYGRIPALPVRVEGLGAIPARTLRYRAP